MVIRHTEPQSHTLEVAEVADRSRRSFKAFIKPRELARYSAQYRDLMWSTEYCSPVSPNLICQIAERYTGVVKCVESRRTTLPEKGYHHVFAKACICSYNKSHNTSQAIRRGILACTVRQKQSQQSTNAKECRKTAKFVGYTDDQKSLNS